jgi:hypothetical protein
MEDPKKIPKSDLSSGLRGEILKWLILALLAGAAVPGLCWGIAVFYGMDEEMEKTVHEYRQKDEERMQRARALTEYLLRVGAEAFRRSTERVEQVRKLDMKNGKITHDAAQEWRRISANARHEASLDLGSLSGAPIKQAPATGELKKNLEDLLQTEIATWESIDNYVRVKENGQNSDKAFDALLKSLMNYQRFLTAYGPTVLAAGKEEIIPAEHELRKDKDNFTKAMDRHKERLNLALGAIGAGVAIIVSIGSFFFWPLMRGRMRTRTSRKKRGRK